MKAKVDQNKCISCGMCVSICPEVFSYNEDDKSEAVDSEIAEEFESSVEECRDVCPVSAIELEL